MMVLIRGLRGDVTEQALRARLEPCSRIRSIELMREGDANQPWACVDFDTDLFGVLALLRRFDRQPLDGSVMRWRILSHQQG